MAQGRQTPAGKPGGGTDSRGNKRIYADVPAHIASELKILAIRRRITMQALMAELIMNAVAGK